MMAGSKQGSVFLSVYVFVVIGIAFLLLIIMGGYVKNQFVFFDDTTKPFYDEVYNQLIEDLHESGESLVLLSPKQSVLVNQETESFVAIKNTGDKSKHFRLSIEFYSKTQSFKSMQPGELMIINQEDKIASSIIWDNSWQQIRAKESLIIPYLLSAPQLK